MAEEKNQKKKPGIFLRILKWFGLGVLILLLIAGLFFRAPLKVNGLLLIFLLACTALPKKAIKWFWLCVGVVVIALIIWVFLPDETQGWRPYTFDEELAALEAKRAIPDEENAARIYNELLGDYNPNVCPVDPNADVQLLLPVREPWKSNEHPRLAQWFKDKQGEITQLLEASEIDKCRFPIETDITGYTQQQVRLARMRRWAYWLVTMANNDRGEGRTDEALKKEIAVLRIAQHQYQQPTIINLLVGVAIESFGIQQVKRVVATGDAGEQYLKTIEQTLSEIEYDWAGDFPRVLDYEKLLVMNIWAICYEVNKDGRVRLTRNLMEAITPVLPEDMQDKPMITYAQRKLAKAFMILLWFYMPSNPKEIGKAVDTAYEKYNEMLKPDYDWSKEPGKYSIDELVSFGLDWRRDIEHSVHTLEETLHNMHYAYLLVTSDKRGSRIMVALRRYKNKTGHWPESLDEVRDLAPEEIFIDPLNNGSFVYKLSDENFTLYSKGKNGVDGGGTCDDEAGADDRPIWP